MRSRAIYTPLRRRADFRRIHAQGRRKGDTVLQVRVFPQPGAAGTTLPRLGILVSKKFGTAVERNRFKRVVRAAMRALGDQLNPGWDILVLPRAAHDVKMQQIYESLHQLLGELGVLREQPADAGNGGGA